MNLIELAKGKKSDYSIWLQKGKILSSEKKNHRDRKGFLERNMLLLAHSLEKGMGVPNPRRGYGKEKAFALANLIKKYSCNYESDSFAFLESVAVLDKYIELMKKQDEAIDSIKAISSGESLYFA